MELDTWSPSVGVEDMGGFYTDAQPASQDLTPQRLKAIMEELGIDTTDLDVVEGGREVSGADWDITGYLREGQSDDSDFDDSDMGDADFDDEADFEGGFAAEGEAAADVGEFDADDLGLDDLNEAGTDVLGDATLPYIGIAGLAAMESLADDGEYMGEADMGGEEMYMGEADMGGEYMGEEEMYMGGDDMGGEYMGEEEMYMGGDDMGEEEIYETGMGEGEADMGEADGEEIYETGMGGAQGSVGVMPRGDWHKRRPLNAALTGGSRFGLKPFLAVHCDFFTDMARRTAGQDVRAVDIQTSGDPGLVMAVVREYMLGMDGDMANAARAVFNVVDSREDVFKGRPSTRIGPYDTYRLLLFFKPQIEAALVGLGVRSPTQLEALWAAQLDQELPTTRLEVLYGVIYMVLLARQMKMSRQRNAPGDRQAAAAEMRTTINTDLPATCGQ